MLNRFFLVKKVLPTLQQVRLHTKKFVKPCIILCPILHLLTVILAIERLGKKIIITDFLTSKLNLLIIKIKKNNLTF